MLSIDNNGDLIVETGFGRACTLTGCEIVSAWDDVEYCPCEAPLARGFIVYTVNGSESISGKFKGDQGLFYIDTEDNDFLENPEAVFSAVRKVIGNVNFDELGI